MKKFYFLALMALSISSYAQTKITGVVTDGAGDPLAFANILEKGTQNGTTTADDGTYSLQLSDDKATLIFSYLGYISQEVQVENQSIINVTLKEGAELDQIVVTALGVRREERELGYVVQTLDSEDITEVKAVNLVDNLSGKIAGVTVTQGATGVGSSSTITIRGEASFSNNNPLFIVDGTPVNNNTPFNFTSEAAAGFQEVDFGNGAGEINQDDIASVSVLKGPGAAALYGTRASNGVIIIETKNGTSDKMSISYNSSFFVDTAFKLPNFQNKYGQGNSGQFEYVDGLGGGVNDIISYSWGPLLDTGLMIPQYDSPVTLPDGTVVRGGDTSLYSGLPITATPFVSNPDNLKNFYETGYTAINNLAVGSAFEKGNYRLSFTDLRSESIIPGVDLDRQTVAAKLNFEPSKNTTIRASVNYVNSQSGNRPSNGYGSENVNYSLVAWGPRSLNIENLKDYWQPGLEGIQQYSFNYTYFDNPYFILHENRNSFNRDRLFGNISLSRKLTEKLTATIRTGMDYSNEKRRFLRNFSTNRFSNGAYAEHDVFYREINTDFLLNFSDSFGDISLDVSAGGNRLDQTASTTQVQTTNLAQPGIFSLNNAASPIESFGFRSEKRINSLYAFARTGYKNYLYLDLTARNDWSSSLATPFSADNVSFFYPSVSTSFVLSNVVDLPREISFAKLRASFAQVGNDTDPYQIQGTFVSRTPVNSQPTFSSQDFLPNRNLRPEQTSSFEVGMDVRFFKQRLNLDVTYYNQLTEDQILSLPVAISSGYSQQVVNGGKVRTQGVEIVLNANPVRSSNFSWNTTANFSSNRARVESLPQDDGRLTLVYSRVYNNPDQTVWHQVEEGGRVGDLYGTGYLRNEDGDFIITDEGRFIADPNLQKLGNYNPDFILGLNNEFQYKNWDAGFLFEWRQGGILVSRTLALAGVAGQLEETAFRPEDGIVANGVVNTGTEENPVYVRNTTAVSPESYYRQFYDRNHEENNTYDASYLKLRQFSIGYNFDVKQNFIKNLFPDGAKMRVSLIGRNLFAVSEIPHFDPEQMAVQGQGFVSGVEDMSYASTRSIGVKASINF